MTEPAFLTTTRTAYDTVAADYAARFDRDLAERPFDRALLAAYAELVRTAGNGPVVEVGCGAGYATAHLHGLGLDVSGVDLSPEMVAQARRAHPTLRFEEGSMTALDRPDGALGGIVALYSIISIPPDRLPDLFAEFHRVLAPGGQVLLAFQVGDRHRHLTEWFGHAISLDTYLRSPEAVVDRLTDAGLATHVRVRREPDGVVEKVPRSYLMARKVDDAAQ